MSAPLRVLLADDHAAYRLGLARAIERWDGLDLVAQASDGEQALALAVELAPDILVLDMRMPGLDGLEVARQATARIAAIVIMITGGDTEELAAPAREAGAREVLSKTLSRQEICRRLLAHR
jgi:DNA-binding NarL/FixJ family response regulator